MSNWSTYVNPRSATIPSSHIRHCTHRPLPSANIGRNNSLPPTHVPPTPFLHIWLTQGHMLRERRPSTTFCPGCWAMGTQNKKVCCEEIIFVLDWLEQPRRIKISCTDTTSPINHSRKDPFHLYSISPHLVQFQQSAGATPLWAHPMGWMWRLGWTGTGLSSHTVS